MQTIFLENWQFIFPALLGLGALNLVTIRTRAVR